jgi:uncharacterized cofD-like protein
MIAKSMKIRKVSWYKQLIRTITRSLRWLEPGLGVKRWILLVLFGTTFIGVGLAVLALEVYRNAPETWWLPILSAASLRVFARPIRALIFGSIGLSFIIWGIWGLNRSILAPFRKPGRTVVDELTTHRRRERGPRIVVIGGGHGLSILLRGLKAYSYNITAVVTVADDGGSSGRLRKSMGILPPGDIRNCLAALSNDEALMAQLFQYRFANGDNGLHGHSFGNLFISALAEITGSFEEAVAESGRVLAVHGRVLPATLHDVRLVADMSLPNAIVEVRVEGESRIPEFPGRIHRVWLEPGNPPAYPLVIQAILAADLIIIGPGSLYTSILPNLLVPDVSASIRASRALKIFVCNVANQPGETDGFNCMDHIRVCEAHVGEALFELVVANTQYNNQLPEGIEWVISDEELESDYAMYYSDLTDEQMPWHHDHVKLAQVIMDLYQERTGPLVN